MRKVLVLAMMILVAGLIGATVVFAGGGDKAKTGVLGDEELIAYASTGGFGSNSGREWSATGNVGGLGAVTVVVSGSWSWDTYNGTDYPCALMNRTAKTFPDDGGAVRHGHPNPFTTYATVTITTENGDRIDGAIMGGSVCELEVFGWQASINEWLISFAIDGGTGKFETSTGTGLIRMLWDSGTGDPAYVDSAYKDDPERFKDHEIFLHVSP